LILGNASVLYLYGFGIDLPNAILFTSPEVYNDKFSIYHGRFLCVDFDLILFVCLDR